MIGVPHNDRTTLNTLLHEITIDIDKSSWPEYKSPYVSIQI